MVNQKEKQLASILLGLGIFLGPGMILAFWVFLYTGPNGFFKFAATNSDALRFNGFLSLLFFLQHSLMIRKPFRKMLTRFFPDHYYGVIFSILSGGLLLTIILFWQESPLTLFSVEGAFRSLFRWVYFLCIAGFAWCIWALGSLDPFGLQAMMDHVKGRQRPPRPFIIRGPYRWVRHPVYFIWLVIFWAYPDLTLDRLMLNVFWSLWIIIAVYFEERDMVRSFGAAYLQYRNEVPMLIPKTFRPIR